MAKKARRKGGRTSLRNISMGTLQAEIERRKRASGPLMRKREKLLKQLTTVNAQLGMPDGAPALPARRGGRRGRAGNGTLVEALLGVLSGATLGVTEAGEAVRRAGYKTRSPNFRTIVNQALLKHTDKFRKVSRGQYTAA